MIKPQADNPFNLETDPLPNEIWSRPELRMFGLGETSAGIDATDDGTGPS